MNEQLLDTQSPDTETLAQRVSMFEVTKKRQDVNEDGALWYKNRFGALNFEKIFGYLEVLTDEELHSKFLDENFELVSTQLAFQKSVRQFQESLKKNNMPQALIESKLAELQNISSRLETLKGDLVTHTDEDVASKMERRKSALEAFRIIGNESYQSKTQPLTENKTGEAQNAQVTERHPNDLPPELDAYMGATARTMSDVSAHFGYDVDARYSSQQALDGSKPAPETDPSSANTSGTEGVQQKGYEERLLIRNEWKQKKQMYEEAYEKYLEEKATTPKSLFSLFKKTEEPETLQQLEMAYQQSRREYASMLDTALVKRVQANAADVSDTSVGSRSESVQAALANRFVLKAAHDRLQIEKEFVPVGKPARIFQTVEEIFKKHKRSIKILGYLTTAGIGLSVGGIGMALSAMLGKTISAKFAAVGAAGGAFAGNALYDALILKKREEGRNSAFERARQSYSTANLDALEKEYLGKYRSYESAVRNKKYAVAASAIAGGIAGATLAGSLDIKHAIDHIPTTSGALNAHGALFNGSSPMAASVELNGNNIDQPVPTRDAQGRGEAGTGHETGGATITSAPVASVPIIEAHGDAFTGTTVEGDATDINEPSENVTEVDVPLQDYTVKAGDNFWDLSEGQTDAPQPYVFKGFSGHVLQERIDLTRDYLNEHADIAKQIGFTSSGNIGKIYPGDVLKLDLLNEVAAKVMADHGLPTGL